VRFDSTLVKNLLNFSTTSSCNGNNINAPRGVVTYTNTDTQKLEILRVLYEQLVNGKVLGRNI
jgi:hypothetical protein